MLELAPQQILSNPRGICFCDVVHRGGTFRELFFFLIHWAAEKNLDPKALCRKLEFLGVTSRTKNSPNTWRWQQHADWVEQHGIAVKNVSIPGDLWHYFGNEQEKVSRGNPPVTWESDAILLPPRLEGHILALRLAFDVFRRGQAEKKDFSTSLAELEEVREAWLRGLIGQLRRSPRS